MADTESSPALQWSYHKRCFKALDPMADTESLPRDLSLQACSRFKALDPMADTERIDSGSHWGQRGVSRHSIRWRILKVLSQAQVGDYKIGFKALDPMADTESQDESDARSNPTRFQGTRSDGGY